MTKDLLGVNFDSWKFPDLVEPGRPLGRFSCERQDEFVYHLLAGHMDGTGFFLDIGCATPKECNNTYVLEKYLGWEGIAFDIGDVDVNDEWTENRSAPFHQIDATSEEFATLLQNLVGDRLVDYISLDVDRADTQNTHKALEKIIAGKIQFKIMTLEHESFKYGDLVTSPTRKLLREKGYQMLFEDVCFPDTHRRHTRVIAWEDWWIKPELLPHENIMSIGGKELTYHECVERVKKL